MATTTTTVEDDRRSYSVAALAGAPERLAETARWAAEQVLRDCLRHGHDPAGYADDAVERRAERDVASDLEGDVRLGWLYTPEEARTYRDVYVAAFARAWRDEGLIAQIRAKHTGTITVCFR